MFDVAAKTGWLTTFTEAVPVSPKVRENLAEAVARNVVQAHGEERAKVALAAYAQATRAGRQQVRNAGAWLCVAIVRGVRPNLVLS